MDDYSMDAASVHELDASSDFEPQTKSKAPTKPKPAPKKAAAAPKPKTKQTTLKPTKPAPKAQAKKRTKPDSDDENSNIDMDSNHDDSLLSNTPPAAKKQKKAPALKKAAKQPLGEVENDSLVIDSASGSKTNSTENDEKYQRLTQLEHILKRPDTYIGSVERTTEQMWTYNSDTEVMENRKVSYVPGLYKIFDEILVNAADNKQNDENMNEMRVWVDAEKGVISVKNNGRGIPIEIHKKEGIYIPEMIFGHLLTSSNYNDDQAKVTGGRNGYGAKLTNIYSLEFQLETVDTRTKQKYRQTWRNNMSVMEKARITPVKSGSDYTQITFRPDFSKFGMDSMDDDFVAMVKRRVYDMAGTCKGVKVYLNDERIKISKFKQYMEMYTKAIKTENITNDGTAAEQVILTDNPHERWEIGFAVSDGSFQQVSFVNSIATTSGGSHVNYVADQICDKLEEHVNKKNKGGVKLKKAQIRNHIFLFVNCMIENPAFTSQTKEQLTTKPSAFGSKPTVSEKFLTAITKTEAVANIIHYAQQKADKVLAKSDGSRRQRMNNAKLTDANKAGTKDGYRCTLILTEGDSASLLALAGRAVVDPDLFGVFPLRGKLLNVRDASIDQISKNAEIQNIKKFIGLQHKKEYTDCKGLRYGHLMIMTDQDHDGSHIKGLLINFLQVQFPSLLKLKGFLLEFITPIVKVWKGDIKAPKGKRDFFTMPEYEAWRQLPGNDKWEHKYYKGLGTSNTSDAQEYFHDLDKHLKHFHTMQEGEPELIDLAFSKKKADARKTWLQNFVPGTFLDMNNTEEITYDDFINKELILYSMADNGRSIPSVVDGFKPGQRKVLYTCFRRNLVKDVKVVELAGSVSGLTAYMYGDTSLQQTIVGLAQDFVGSNNINTLEPSGNFGSRLQGGNDAASARYIYTRLSPFARKIFNKSDEALLSYNMDDGKTIEPEVYVPIVPMILVNGADGIGTGWSTSIPNYHPKEIIENLMRRMDGESKEDMLPMKPWFRGWSGETEQLADDKFKFAGAIGKTGETEVQVTELPVRLWTQDFKDRLEEIIKAEKTPSFIKDYTEYNTPETVHFIIKLEEKKMKDHEEKLEELFKLSKTMTTTNLVAFDPQGRIHKYASPLDIMEEFYHVRLRMYQKRKAHLLHEMGRELDKLNNQAKFVQMIIDNKLVVSKKKKAVLVAELQKLGFTRFPKVADAKKQGEFEEIVEEQQDETDDAEAAAGASDYDYLLGMAIWSLTQERVEKLRRQIGDKEEEVEKLQRKSPKDLWKDDLGELLEEWETQLVAEATQQKKVRAKGRRASAKLGIGGKGGNKKRKNGDSDSDDDFMAKKPKAKGFTKSKSAAGLLAIKHESEPPGVYPLVNGIEQKPLARPPAEKEIPAAFAADKVKVAGKVSKDPEPRPVPAVKDKMIGKIKATAKKLPQFDDFDDSEGFLSEAVKAPSKPAAAPARVGRAAAAKAKRYTIDSDDDDDILNDDDDFDMKDDDLDDVGESRSNGLSNGNDKSKTKATGQMDISEDEDEWASLAQNSPQKNTQLTLLSGDEDDDLLGVEAPKPVAKGKQAASSKAVPKLKTSTKSKEPVSKPTKVPPAPAAPLATMALSPAAKAYKAKLTKTSSQVKAGAPKLKKARRLDSDEEDEDVDQLANDILSDDNDDDDESIQVKPVARTARRAAATTKKSTYVIDDEDEEDVDVDDDESEAEFDDDESE